MSLQNEALNRWKDEFLQQEFGGVEGDNQGGTTKKKKRKKLPRGEVKRVVISLTHVLAGQGVTFRPSVDFYNAESEEVRPVPYEWDSTDWAVATVDADLNTITTHKPGKTEIRVKCKDSDVQSNPMEIEVLDIKKIVLSPSEIEVSAGSKQPINAIVTTSDGRTLEGVYLIWTENDRSIVSVSSSGMVFGLVPGETEVIAGDNQTVSENPTKVKVGEQKQKGDKGSGFPRILLSEIDPDPLGEGPPRFSSADPPVVQRPQDFDANIWWINMASPLARRYIDIAKGGGARSPEWRVYLIERYIEIMVKILLHYAFNHGETLTFETMLHRWEEESTNMQQRITESLSGYLDNGEIDESEAAAA